jgi:hypothetical protein
MVVLGGRGREVFVTSMGRACPAKMVGRRFSGVMPAIPTLPLNPHEKEGE